VNRGINLLSTVISHVIIEWLLLPFNPIRLIKRPKQPPHRTRRVGSDPWWHRVGCKEPQGSYSRLFIP
jgi:hypothetical protein